MTGKSWNFIERLVIKSPKVVARFEESDDDKGFHITWSEHPAIASILDEILTTAKDHMDPAATLSEVVTSAASRLMYQYFEEA